MRLIDLDPRWFDMSGVDTGQDGLSFLCPCAKCIREPQKQVRIAVQFLNPIGKPSPAMPMSELQMLRHVHELLTFDVPPGYLWMREGETFETLTLRPSVDASNAGHWHGFITNGEII